MFTQVHLYSHYTTLLVLSINCFMLRKRVVTTTNRTRNPETLCSFVVSFLLSTPLSVAAGDGRWSTCAPTDGHCPPWLLPSDRGDNSSAVHRICQWAEYRLQTRRRSCCRCLMGESQEGSGRQWERKWATSRRLLQPTMELRV